MRSFTIIEIKKSNGSNVKYTGGRFVGESPSSCARKMFSKAYNYLKGKGPMTLKITLRETTQNSLKKEYTYRVKKISDYKEIERNNQLIIYRYSTKVKSV